jgi:hypothetical protein
MVCSLFLGIRLKKVVDEVSDAPFGVADWTDLIDLFVRWIGQIPVSQRSTGNPTIEPHSVHEPS